MVGKKFAQFLWIEVKTPKGRASTEQLELHAKFRNDGTLGDICHSAEEAIILIRNLKGGI